MSPDSAFQRVKHPWLGCTSYVPIGYIVSFAQFQFYSAGLFIDQFGTAGETCPLPSQGVQMSLIIKLT